jgi:transglutaminase-like putative cysteine protease
MRRYAAWCVVLVVTAAPARAQAPPPKVVKETWDAVYLEGAKCGSFHTVTADVRRDGARLFRSTMTMNLRVRRYNAVLPMRLEIGDEETPDGKVRSMWMTQFLDRGSLTQTAVVEGDELVVGGKGPEGGRTKSDATSTPKPGSTGASSPDDGRRSKWDATALGRAKQDSIFRDRKVKPGDRFSYRSYEPPLWEPVAVRVAVKDPEEVDVLVPGREGEKAGAARQKRKLLRVEAVSDKVEIGGNAVQLPRVVWWLDDQREIARSEVEQPGLGTLTLYRTTKAVAEEEGAAPALLPDLGWNTLVPLNRGIARPHEAAAVVYRVTVKGDDDPSTAFARDARQQPSDVQGAAFTLTVRRPPVPAEETGTGEVKPEFSKSSYFLDSDDEWVRARTAAAVGREADPWRKAQRVERWVYDHMTGADDVAYVPASRTARDLKGDCRQHAMLTAAMCRAAGVPARTAVGLVYVNDPRRGPLLVFHMWTEVRARGQWLGIDATLGRGGVGPAHLKIADSSWHDTQTLAPLLPMSRVAGRLAIEVVKVEER